MSSDYVLVSGRANPELAKRIAENLGKPLFPVDILQFKDGEIQVYFNDTIRGKNVFIIQPTFSPADNIIELLITIDAAKRASARNITAVIPYFGYARQDRRPRSSRVPITAKVVADMLTTVGIDRVVMIDLHADQIQGFMEFPVDHLFVSNVFIPYIKELNLPNICIASPDTGGTKRASTYAKALECDLAIGYKQRVKQNEVAALQIIGDVKDKNVIIVDDIIDTAGTLCKAAARIKEMGAASVRAMCAHGLFSGNAIENIENSVLDEVIIADTIPLRHACDKIKVISVAKLLAEVIQSVVDDTSISSHYYV